MPQKPNHIVQFCQNAQSYNRHNIIQDKVAKYLISKINYKPKNILDLGAGSGAIYKLIDWDIDRFIAVDFADDLLNLHPKHDSIEFITADFDDENLYKNIGISDLAIASSSLQWSKNLPKTLSMIAKHTRYIAFAIFCDKTFKSIREITKLNTFLMPSKDILDQIDKYFEIEYEVIEYKLKFDDNLSKFRYIKNSGVSGGNKQLSYKQMKNLIKNYPLKYLEFEVLFVWGKVKGG